MADNYSYCKCNYCGFYDETVDACNADEHCYQEGYLKGIETGNKIAHKGNFDEGYNKAIDECLNIVRANGYQVSLIMIKALLEQLKEQKNET